MTDELERLALAGWPSHADVRVTGVTIRSDRAEVALVVDGYEYWMYFKREEHDTWSETVSGNTPTSGWDDPSVIEW